MNLIRQRLLLAGVALLCATPVLAKVDPKTVIEQGSKLEGEKKYAEATALYTTLIQDYPVESRPYELRGWAQYRGKSTLQWDQAKHATRDSWERLNNRKSEGSKQPPKKDAH